MSSEWRSQLETKQYRIRLWTERLYRDFDHIVYSYGVRLCRPMICVSELDSLWGQWNPLTRVITISQKLIEGYPWDIVLEILKHEMAHQIVDEVYKYRDLHGPHFRRACDLLGVAPWAQTATGDLPREIPDWKQSSLSGDEERLLKRIEKLLALANSSNEHEAALAMERVRHMYAKHHIDRIASQRPSSMVHCVITRRKKRTESFESLIFSIINEHFYVRCIHTSIFDAQTCDEYKAVELLGTRENVLVAEYVYHFLWNTLQELWGYYQVTAKHKSVRAKRSYMLGVLSGFRAKLAQDAFHKADHPNRTAGECHSLIAQGQAELSRFVRIRYPKLATRSWCSGPAEKASFEAGRAEGVTLNLRRGLHHRDGNKGHLLT